MISKKYKRKIIEEKQKEKEKKNERKRREKIRIKVNYLNKIAWGYEEDLTLVEKKICSEFSEFRNSEYQASSWDFWPENLSS